MRWLLDTNVISTLIHPAPDPRAIEWIRAQPTAQCGVSVMAIGEIEKGIARLEPGKKRTELERWAESDLLALFRNRILDVDLATAKTWARLEALGRRSGRPLPLIDGLMLATAHRHGLVLVTRNVSDCAQRGQPVFDPFTGTMHA